MRTKWLINKWKMKDELLKKLMHKAKLKHKQIKNLN